MNSFKLALRFLLRDGRSGELSILISALIIAVTSTTAISLFSDRLHRTMNTQAAEFLAADLVITSPALIPQSWLNKAEELKLDQAMTAEFSSVLIENDELLLAGVKAVSHNYPLRGYLKTTSSNYINEQVKRHGPSQGQAWVEKRILSALKLQPGDSLQVGEKKLTISQIITYEPDKRGDLYSLSPRVMINSSDLAATQVIKPGSHVHYFFQFSGSAKALSKYNHWLKPQLNASQRLMDIQQDRPELGSALNRAQRYLGLSSIVVVLIAGVAIAMSARRYSERHFDTTAILRCLGSRQNKILALYCWQFLILGVLASAAGAVFGWFVQQFLFHLLRDLLPDTIAKPGIYAVLLGFVTGLIILFGFAFPPLLRLKKVSPLRVLRREMEPLPTRAWIVYGLAVSLLALLIWQYTEDLKMTAAIIGGGMIMLLFFGWIIFLLLSFSQRLLPYLGLHWRFGLQGLVRHRNASVSQILAFSLTLLAMILSFTVRNDLLDDWKKQLPASAPNHFVLNIFPQQLTSFKQMLQQQNIEQAHFYPVIRGRLIKINQIPVQQIVSKDSQGERATHRDLSLTWVEKLPDDNKTIAGHWDSSKIAHVSIEQKLAKSLHVKLADQLTFTVGNQSFQATVFHIRSVRWDTMKPNFYMVFTPNTLNNFASTYMTSFYLPADSKKVLNLLVQYFPGITILEVDQILKQFKKVLSQLTAAINYLLYFALSAGILVLFSAVYASLDHRIYQGALLRTLGANRRLIRKVHFIEFSLIGLCSGFIAVFMSELLRYLLYAYVLKLDYHINWPIWIALPVISSLCIAITGYWGTRSVISQSPMQVFRKR